MSKSLEIAQLFALLGLLVFETKSFFLHFTFLTVTMRIDNHELQFSYCNKHQHEFLLLNL